MDNERGNINVDLVNHFLFKVVFITNMHTNTALAIHAAEGLPRIKIPPILFLRLVVQFKKLYGRTEIGSKQGINNIFNSRLSIMTVIE